MRSSAVTVPQPIQPQSEIPQPLVPQTKWRVISADDGLAPVAEENLQPSNSGVGWDGQSVASGVRPLFVDLDGSLIATDLLHEGAVRALRRTPALFWHFPKWLKRGLTVFKQRLALQEPVAAAGLPYRQEVLDLLRSEHAAGRPIILATASHELWAEAVAEHLGCFHDVIATDAHQNRKSESKLAAMRAWCEQHGFRHFDYIGDSSADRVVWQSSQTAYLVGQGSRYREALTQQGVKCEVLAPPGGTLRAVLKAIRPHQWAKNILIFAPILLAHVFTDLGRILAAGAAFVSFSLCASAVYVLNDLLDIDNDRQHPTKRRRPLAAGLISIPQALLLIATLTGAAFGLAAVCLPMAFTVALGVYAAVTTAYSVVLKRLPLVDVFCLAGLYTSRLIAGGLATETPVSEWLMSLSVFLFTSLAFAKRYSELTRLARDSGLKAAEGAPLDGNSEEQAAAGRGYLVSDLSIIESLGPTCGYLGVLVLALYINSEAVTQIYRVNWPLWLMCPLLMYWITRVWFLAKRCLLNEDPVVFALKDNVSRVIGILVGTLFVLSVAGAS